MSLQSLCVKKAYCWIVVVIIWTQIVGASPTWSLYSIEAHTRETVATQGRELFRLIQFMRRWNASHGGIYVPLSQKAPSNPYLKDQRRDVATTDGVKLTLLNPSYMARQVSEFAREEDFYFNITSLKPIRPSNTPDYWERLALQAFEQGLDERLDLVRSDEHEMYRYMAPLMTKAECLPCHAEQGYKVGDVRGGISVSISAKDIVAGRNRQMWIVSVIHAVVWTAVSGLIFSMMTAARRRIESMATDLAAHKQTISDGQQALRVANEKITSLESRDCQGGSPDLESLDQRLQEVFATHQRLVSMTNDLATQQRTMSDSHQALREAEEKRNERRQNDTLTGLMGRRPLERRLQEALDRAAARQRLVGLIMLKIDHFQDFNQKNGAIEGDAALRCVADAISAKAASSKRLVGRYVGASFLVAMAADDLARPQQIAKEIQQEVHNLGIRHDLGDDQFLSVSCGVGLVAGQDNVNAPNLLSKMLTDLQNTTASGSLIEVIQ